jgi:hypothetical protein
LQDLYTMTGTRDSSDLTAMEAKSKASDGVTLRSAPQERDEQSSRQTFAQVSSENETLQTNQISIDENSEGEDGRKVKLRVVIGNKHITSSDEDDSVINNDSGDDSSKSLSYHEYESFESSRMDVLMNPLVVKMKIILNSVMTQKVAEAGKRAVSIS